MKVTDPVAKPFPITLTDTLAATDAPTPSVQEMVDFVAEIMSQGDPPIKTWLLLGERESKPEPVTVTVSPAEAENRRM